jgi:hypothetical protein
MEMRLTNIGSGTSQKIVDNPHFYIKINGTSGTLTVYSWDSEIVGDTLDVGGFSGHLTDVTIRVQKDITNNRYTIEAWDSSSTTRFASGTGTGTGMASRNFGTDVFYIGARSIEQSGSAGEYFDGRIAFLRWYSTLVDYSASTKPTLYSNSAQLLQMEYESNLNDSSGNSQTFTGVGSPTYNTTPTINPTASAGTDVGGRVAGVTFSLDASNSAPGDVGPITSYSWTRTSGSGSISSPSSASTNITGISSGQSTFQVEVGDGTNTSTDSVDVGVVSVNADGTVDVGNSSLDLILGPLLPAGSTGAAVMPYYDVNQEESYAIQRNKPSIAPRTTETGTLGVTNGSTAVVGTGTRFTKDLALTSPGGVSIPLYILGVSYQISSVTDDTHLTLTTTYAGSTTSGITNWNQNGADEATNYTSYWGYYDAVLTAYIAYYRTGLTKWLTESERLEDAWWTKEGINYGATDVSNSNAPREVALAGLIISAIRGKVERWDWINRYVDYHLRSVWVMPRITYPGLYFGTRDPGYTLWFAILLSQVLPNTYTLYGNGTLAASTGSASDGATKRTAYFDDSLNAAINYFCRLQRPDGSWRWGQDETDTLGSNINSSVTSLTIAGPNVNFRTAGDLKIDDEIMSYTSRSSGTISGITRGKYGTTAASHSSGALVTDLSLGFIEQVFHVGVGLGAAFYDLCRIIGSNPTYQAEYNTLRQALIRNAAEGMLMGYDSSPVIDTPSINARRIAYALHSWGDWGDTKDGMPDTVNAWPTIADIRDARQNIVTWTHIPAYAYHLTGLQWFKDKIDEILSANWGKTGYAGTIGTSDGYYALQDYFTPDSNRRMKEYNEWHRYVGRAFAARYVSTAAPANEPPWVSVSGGDRVFPNGTSSAQFTVQPVGTGPFTYLWTNKGVNTATLSGDTTATVTASSLVTDGQYGLRVAVTDVNGKTTYGFVNFRNISRFTEQRPPVASVPSQNVSLSAGTTSTSTALNLSGSTAFGGRTLKYRWFQTSGPSVTISNSKVANPSVSGLTNSTYTFRGFVWDNLTRTEEETGTDVIDVKVSVSGGSSAPSVKLVAICM